jgi:hypothetical protein
MKKLAFGDVFVRNVCCRKSAGCDFRILHTHRTYYYLDTKMHYTKFGGSFMADMVSKIWHDIICIANVDVVICFLTLFLI